MTVGSKMRISVAMCTYNGERFLPEQLASVARQSRLPDEMVICDDQSTDSTVAILRDFAATASFPVKIVVNRVNLGYTENFAQAISACTGEFIALSDQDDVWHPNRLQRSAKELEDHLNAILVFSNADVIDEQSRSLKTTLWQSVGFTRSLMKRLSDENFIVLAKHRFVTGATVMFRSELRAHILPIPPGWIHDEWIVLIAAAFGKIQPIDEPLICYRSHASQQVGFRNKLKERTQGDHWARLAESARELQQVCDALAATPMMSRPALAGYRQHLHFLRFRAHLPGSATARLFPVLLHLAGYHVHASGWKSALKDLLSARSRS